MNNIILKYEGPLTQEIISSNITTIENGIENLGITAKVATTTIELSQNMMTYSKDTDQSSTQIVPNGFIKVSNTGDRYYVTSKNIISLEDKQRVEPKLIDIHALDMSGIKKKYKELRRSGKNAHDNNAGIGFYEIAKISVAFEYSFEVINETRFYFMFKAIFEPKKK